jgi:hypothetical protein
MARQQLTEAVGIDQPLNRIAGALGRPGDDVSVEPVAVFESLLVSSCPALCGRPRRGACRWRGSSSLRLSALPSL